MKILVMNGPNMQLLGHRNPKYYGTRTLSDIEAKLKDVAKELGIAISFIQSNHEGDLCDAVASAMKEKVDGIVLNPAAYTHTSLALHDALEAAEIPTIEVHMSNILAREDIRKTSITGSVCLGQITGLGADSYEWALRAIHRYLLAKSNINQ